MKIKNVSIEAFRCFDFQSLDFEDGDGNLANLIVFYAPNGFGKTSLFDAIEYGMTGSVNRFMKGVYKKDNMADKQLRDKHSFLFNKNVDPRRQIKISLRFDGAFRDVDRSFTLTEENVFSALPCNGFFKDVILSQEWFDYFIRTTTPEDRCKIFFEYFGMKDDLLAYNKELENARSKLKSEITSLEKTINSLLASLKEQDKSDALILLRQASENFKEEGWTLPPCENVNADNIKELLIFGETKKEEISRNLLTNKGAFEAVGAIVDGSSESVTIADIKVCIENLDRLKVSLQDTDSYIEKQNRLILLQKNLRENQDTLNSIASERNVIVFYMTNIDKISEYKNRLYQLRKDKEENKERLDVENKRIEKLRQDREVIKKERMAAERAFYDIRTLLNDLEKIFSDYKDSIENNNQNELKIKTKGEEIESLETKNKTLNDDINAIEAFRKKLEQGVDASLLVCNLYRIQVLALFECMDKIKEIEKQKSDIDNKRCGHQLYKSEVQKLVESSKTIYSELKNGKCPLCGYDWESTNELIRSIENNKTIDETIERLSKLYDDKVKEAEGIWRDIYEIRKAIEIQIKDDIIDKQNETIQNNNTIKSLQKDILSLQESQKELKESIARYSERFGDLDYPQIKDNVEDEYNRNEKVLDSLRGKEGEINARIDASEKQLNKLSDDNKKLDSVYEIMVSDDFYMKTKACYDNLDSPIAQLEESWRERKRALDKALDDVNKKQKIISEDINNIHGLGVNEFDKDKRIEKRDKLRAEQLSYLRKMGMMIGVINGVIIEKLSVVDSFETIEDRLQKELIMLKTTIDKQNKLLHQVENFITLINKADEYLGYKRILHEIQEKEETKKNKECQQKVLDEEKEKLTTYVKNYVDNFFDKDLINQLYNTIDPHPKFKTISFDCDFEKQIPRLFVKMGTQIEGSDEIVPNLYFSSAQINILSFCIFLAKALNAKDDDGNSVDCMFIDDPIQAMDDINVLSVVDLLRNVAFTNKKQVVLTTHDQNFYELLKKKCPAYIFKSKFFKFMKKGVIIEDNY